MTDDKLCVSTMLERNAMHNTYSADSIEFNLPLLPLAGKCKLTNRKYCIVFCYWRSSDDHDHIKMTKVGNNDNLPNIKSVQFISSDRHCYFFVAMNSSSKRWPCGNTAYSYRYEYFHEIEKFILLCIH